MKTSIKEERLKAGLSQAELATRLGITQSTIQPIEAGRREPRVLLAISIAEYFGKDVKDMFWKY